MRTKDKVIVKLQRLTGALEGDYKLLEIAGDVTVIKSRGIGHRAEVRVGDYMSEADAKALIPRDIALQELRIITTAPKA